MIWRLNLAGDSLRLLVIGGEGAFFSLLVPLLNPSRRADSFEVLLKELARLVLLILDLLTTVEVNIVLPAVSRLVLVWEPGVKGDGLHLSVFCHLLSCRSESSNKSLVLH